MRDVFRTIERIAKAEATVLVTGESGTGKELVARAIHDLSPRADKPFVAVNCGAIPSELIESELFGHEKGAFTGASERRAGRSRRPMAARCSSTRSASSTRLCRSSCCALRERTFERVGSSQSITVDVRIVTATNRDLAEEVENGNFREDLYYRVAVVPVSLPPLRDRREDIRLLAQHFVERLGPDRQLAPAAIGSLEGYGWPGNVRELENAISTPSPWRTARRSTERPCRRRSATRGRRKPCASSGDKASAVSRRRSRASRPTSCAKPSPPTAGIRPRPPARSGSRAASSS